VRTVAAANKIDSRIDLPTAKLAIKEYAARNNMFHSKSMAHKFAKDWTGLVHQARDDIEALPTILPDGSAEDVETWTKIIEFYQSQHVVYDDRAGQWTAKPAANPRPTVAEPQIGTTRDIRHLPPEIQEQSFMAGDFRREKKPIVQGLTSSRRRGFRSHSPNSEQLKRWRELLDQEEETMRKRQELVDSRLNAAAHEKPDNVAIHAALKDLANLHSVDPEKGKKVLTKFVQDVGNGLEAHTSALTKAANRQRRKGRLSRNRTSGE
jgi:hypothetical protein